MYIQCYILYNRSIGEISLFKYFYFMVFYFKNMMIIAYKFINNKKKNYDKVSKDFAK